MHRAHTSGHPTSSPPSAGPSPPPPPDPAGLTAAEASERLRRDGPNELPRARVAPWWRSLGAQFVHFFARMLWLAGALALVAGLPQLGLAIFAVIVINGAFAFAQERRAEHAAERLRSLLPTRARVVRDGAVEEIDARDVVTGDLVALTAGDRIPADLEVREAHACAVDLALLTGESGPVGVSAGDRCYAGTFVVEGEARAEVVATGTATRLAGIALLARAGRRPPSPLAREIERVVRVVGLIAIGVGLTFFAIAWFLGFPPSEGFLFAIGVTVALVPEGLLPTMTLALAIGAQRMADRAALVRRLESVETLGSTTFICTDKTGTLTRNEMTVVALWTPAGPDAVAGTGYDPTPALAPPPDAAAAWRLLARGAARCSDGRVALVDDTWVARGDPMEAAIDAFARRLRIDVDHDAEAGATVRRLPFDPRRRRMAVVTAHEVWVKGAPDRVLGLCTGGTEEPGARRALADAQAALDDLTARGLRVLAVATRAARPDDRTAARDTVEADLVLVGLLGFEDPPRPDAADAVAACRSAGIRVAMVTGDHPATARAIATEIGLLGPDATVVTGADLPDDPALLGALLDRDGIVVARVDPETKLRVLRALQDRGHVIAMTGDGVNDGPALQEADIGIAMGRSGTDVAREAADLVLLDDAFATIVAAVEQGRATFTNVHRFLTYHLVSNVAELVPFVVWALSGGRFPLALGVLQILFLDLGTDLLPALALGAEAPGPHLLARPPTGRHLIDAPLLRRVFLVLGPTEAAVELGAFVAVLWSLGWRGATSDPGAHTLAVASGAAWAAVVFGQVGAAFACRSATRWPGALGWTTNRLLLLAILAELAILAVCLWVPPVADLLGQHPPGPLGLACALAGAPAVLAADAAHKRVRRRRKRPGRDGPIGDRPPTGR